MHQTVQEYFSTLPSRVPPENTAGMTNSFLFEIKNVGTWVVAVDDGTVTVSEGERQADVRLAMSEDLFNKVVTGEQNAVRAFMTGKIKMKGNRAVAAKLQKILTPTGDTPTPPALPT